MELLCLKASYQCSPHAACRSIGSIGQREGALIMLCDLKICMDCKFGLPGILSTYFPHRCIDLWESTIACKSPLVVTVLIKGLGSYGLDATCLLDPIL